MASFARQHKQGATQTLQLMRGGGGRERKSKPDWENHENHVNTTDHLVLLKQIKWGYNNDKEVKLNQYLLVFSMQAHLILCVFSSCILSDLFQNDPVLFSTFYST